MSKYTSAKRRRKLARLADPFHIRITHDMVTNVLLGKPPLVLLPQERERLEHYIEVLCWVLGHDDDDQPGGVFEEHMNRLAVRVLSAAGVIPGPWPEPVELDDEEPVPERVQ